MMKVAATKSLCAEVQKGLSSLRSAAYRTQDVPRDVQIQLKSKAVQILWHALLQRRIAPFAACI